MKILHILCLTLAALVFTPALAQDQPTTKLEIATKPDSKDSLYSVELTDAKTGKPITDDDLEIVHTKKLHLLVIDPSLTEYYHLHPTLVKPDEWEIDFPEGKTRRFRVWADITRKDTSKQEYVMTDAGLTTGTYKIDTTRNLNSTFGEYSFSIEFDKKLKVGKEAIATITVRKNGRPFDQLEPVMGAFAHVVGFNEDYKTIMHTRPLGEEPEKESDRGGADLQFHIEPEKAGFIKIFAQFRINGKDIFVPFGIVVDK